MALSFILSPLSFAAVQTTLCEIPIVRRFVVLDEFSASSDGLPNFA